MENAEWIGQSGSAGIVLEGLTKVFGQRERGSGIAAVDHVDLSVEPGELLAILGPSGCGKTTVLRLLCGFEEPTEGRVLLNGRDLSRVPPEQRGITMVFQNYALFPHLTVWENVAYGLRAAKLPRDEVCRRTDAALELMQLSGLEARYPHQLSGGQQQRTALARAVVIEPRVLLFDEPLCNLDAKLRESMRKELRKLLKQLGITALYVTHDQAEAMALADRIAVMEKGKLCQVGTPDEIYEYPVNRFVASFIGQANCLKGVLEGWEKGTACVRLGESLLRVPDPGAERKILPGDSCWLVIRPEALTLSLEGDGLPGVVTGSTYYGPRVEYELMVYGQSVVAQLGSAGHQERYPVGQQIRLRPVLDSVRVMQTSGIDRGNHHGIV